MGSQAGAAGKHSFRSACTMHTICALPHCLRYCLTAYPPPTAAGGGTAAAGRGLALQPIHPQPAHGALQPCCLATQAEELACRCDDPAGSWRRLLHLDAGCWNVQQMRRLCGWPACLHSELPARTNLQGVAGLPMFYDGPTLSLIQYPPVTEQVRAAAGHVGWLGAAACSWKVGAAAQQAGK